jgi:uncharacterized oxidoreductase
MPRVKADRLTDFVAAIFEANGSNRSEAEAIARHLVGSNLAGHDSHGVVRVPRYVNYVRDGDVLPNRSATIDVDFGGVVVIEGNGGFGQSIGEQAVDIGIRRARELGVALVGIRHVGHMGRLGAWAEQAAAEGLVSLHFVNSPGSRGIQVAPFAGRDRRLAPNPMAIGVPAPTGPHFILDFTTSVVPEGKVLVALNEGKLLPEGAAVDADGNPTREPKDYYGPPAGSLLPIGGHKGSGLCMAIDLLAGALTRGGVADPNRLSFGINSMLSIYVDPARRGSDAYLANAVTELSAWVKSAAPLDEGGEVLVPGEMSERNRRERLAHGIPIDAATWTQIMGTAAELGVAEAGLESLG